ncbi:MAG: hypothetical protein JRC68_00275 [Deltaproteobacteria bacterium]|nr:hypothetical protein [Deltaproteobacteria bacterium]
MTLSSRRYLLGNSTGPCDGQIGSRYCLEEIDIAGFQYIIQAKPIASYKSTVEA